MDIDVMDSELGFSLEDYKAFFHTNWICTTVMAHVEMSLQRVIVLIISILLLLWTKLTFEMLLV